MIMRPHTAEHVIATLEQRGELWRHGAGLSGLRGAPLRLLRRIERLIGHTARGLAHGIEWQPPHAIDFDTLARMDYFALFPQWLTAASRVNDDPQTLTRVACAPDPRAAAAAALTPASYALTPGLCFHAYAALENRTIARPVRATMQGTCWRHEGNRHAPLECDWAFTMREVIHVSTERGVERFCRDGVHAARALGDALHLPYEIVKANDPFFAPTARGKALLQAAQGLKQAMVLPIGDRAVPATTFNHFERFFGHAFGIRLPDGQAACTGCVAFGLEQWLLAFLVRHGPDAHSWPDIPNRLDAGNKA